jgi:hypothetical protein
MPAAQQPGLFIEQRGANLMIRLRGDTDSHEYSMFSAIASLPGNSVVMTSIAALSSRDLPQAVNQAALQALGSMPGPPAPTHRLWLALAGLGRPDTGVRPWPQRLAEDLGVEVLAPQGALSLIPGGLLFTGGDLVWRRFRRGDTSRPWGARHPQPDWEAQLPPGLVAAAGLTVEAIPAGLLVRAEGEPPTPADDPVCAVAVHAARPRLVLGRLGEEMPSPDRIAALVSMFPPTLANGLELVPHSTEASSGWFTELAAELGRDVRAATGLPMYGLDGRVHVIAHDTDGNQLLRHAATSVRHDPDGTVEVLEATPPPTGWVGVGPTFHRLPSALRPTLNEPVAEVVPAGFALVPLNAAGGRHASARRVADPQRLTITVGLPQTPLPSWGPGMLSKLLSGLGTDARARLRVLVPADTTAEQKRALLEVTEFVQFTDTGSGESRARRPVVPAPVATRAVPSARHRSTTVEQLEFRRLTGERSANADMAAVALYLGSGEFGAAAVNSALRSAEGELSDAYLACLTSGLRQLPVHRGVVFRQPLTTDGYGEGDVVTEPGFLSATAAENLTVSDDSANLLIWSRSGRRTDDLGVEGLPQEVVFAAQTKLRVLNVQDGDLLVRELHPDEKPGSKNLDSTDIAVLSKLLRALRRRQATRLHLLEDRDQITRLTTPLGIPAEKD